MPRTPKEYVVVTILVLILVTTVVTFTGPNPTVTVNQVLSIATSSPLASLASIGVGFISIILGGAWFTKNIRSRNWGAIWETMMIILVIIIVVWVISHLPPELLQRVLEKTK